MCRPNGQLRSVAYPRTGTLAGIVTMVFCRRFIPVCGLRVAERTNLLRQSLLDIYIIWRLYNLTCQLLNQDTPSPPFSLSAQLVYSGIYHVHYINFCLSFRRILLILSGCIHPIFWQCCCTLPLHKPSSSLQSSPCLHYHLMAET
jgi:hypothetical protein